MSEVALDKKLDYYEAGLQGLAERCEVEEGPLLDSVKSGDITLVGCLFYGIAVHMANGLEREGRDG